VGVCFQTPRTLLLHLLGAELHKAAAAVQWASTIFPNDFLAQYYTRRWQAQFWHEVVWAGLANVIT